MISRTSAAHRALCFAATGAALLMVLWAGVCFASPIAPQTARIAASNWLKNRSAQGRELREALSSRGKQPWHAYNFDGGGFVILSADDLVEPVVAFSEHGSFDPDAGGPLVSLLERDMQARLKGARSSKPSRAAAGAYESARSRWNGLLADSGTSGTGLAGLLTLSDPRVDPLLASKWGQSLECGLATYNYFTPPNDPGSTGNYPAGCVATAMAQLMRFHQHPQSGVGTPCFTIKVDYIPESRCLRGGDGAGGPYDWASMPLVPGCGATDTQRQAIGALVHDAGVAVGMSYRAGESGSHLNDASAALRNTFGYSQSVYSDSIGSGMANAVNTGLDAGLLSLFGISNWTTGSGHAVVCDGYGFNAGTAYHHLNMGWVGSQDAWYNLPDINTSPSYDGVDDIAYNIRPSGIGEIISGRVTDTFGAPVSGVSVGAARAEGGNYTAATNGRGIYALAEVPGGSHYTVSIAHPGYEPVAASVQTGISSNGGANPGNRWGVNFCLVPKGITKTLQDAEQLTLRRATVSAAFPGCFYVERDDRACGIRVELASHGLDVGRRADLSGVMRTDPAGERYIEASWAVQNGTGAVRPLALNNRDLGGSGQTGQAGPVGGHGANNVGLLVTTAGRVAYVDLASGFYYLNDGADLNDGNTLGAGGAVIRGLRVLASGARAPALGASVTATGISTLALVGGQSVRALRQAPSEGAESDYALPGGAVMRMCYVPAGPFLQGNNGAEGYSNGNELPQHQVQLSGYWIGKSEVTRGQFRQFVDAGGYSNPAYWSTAGWAWRTANARSLPQYWDPVQRWGDPGTPTFAQTDQHPVVGVYYHEAQAFCSWAGGRLPTESQWEKAARWTGTSPSVYPWAGAWSNNYCNNWRDNNPLGGGTYALQTAPAGSYPADVSPYGCVDMAGNASEWCADWYGIGYYQTTPPGGWIDPAGPSSGTSRVLRGSNWSSGKVSGYGPEHTSRAAYRSYSGDAITYHSYGYGFRMVR